MGSLSIRQVDGATRHRAVAVQVTAFCADPLTRWAYPDSRQYLDCFARFVDVFVGPSLDHGTCDVVGDFAGVAFWLPVGVPVDFGALEAVVRDTLERQRRDELFSLFELMDRYAPDGPHWHLGKVGVDPAYRRMGLGSRLMAYRLSMCDAQGLSAYLESSNRENLSFYERLGFEVLGEIQVGSSPALFPMLRQPQ
jgi:ribosomal protein S18 acetylase RimI-like enzyme